MRVHGDKEIRRRDGVINLNDYRDARGILTEDFAGLCGYCGKNHLIMHEKFHIDHFVPKSLDEERINDYYNLVFACQKCNLIKSNKWPTGDKNIANKDNIGFVDPATSEFDKHINRSEQGYIVGLTKLGIQMCSLLRFDIRRTDVYWKISIISELQDSMETLHEQKLLNSKQKDFYIELNKLLKMLKNEAFKAGE